MSSKRRAHQWWHTMEVRVITAKERPNFPVCRNRRFANEGARSIYELVTGSNARYCIGEYNYATMWQTNRIKNIPRRKFSTDSESISRFLTVKFYLIYIGKDCK
ncbi:PREDICTED: uncharacterized protein LOC105451440 [Wasmannia auropunctata]|uniref:uncharacterized protein LOC105451440 n=1 Tax=Wasmannia auropunctata TaxID=64793 RepID=UPI0005EF1E7D|nr:PREDICTED: uncharacterized protein LOC105451440 [Wasmannia auropunctata]